MISVCLVTYNGEKYVVEQIKSILSQLSINDELIVSDDGSNDKTLEKIKALDDLRIKVIKNKEAKGVIGNVENALNHAKGQFIFLADQDDVWLPNKVEICMLGLKNKDLVVSDCYVTDEKLNIISDSFFELNNSKTNKYHAFMRNPYLGCCMAFNRTILDTVLPFPNGIPMHDIWLGNVAAFKYKLQFIPDKLIYYRRHGNNASSTSEPSKTTLAEKIRFRWVVFKYLFLK